MTRLDCAGEPAGGWYPAERVSLEQALRAYGQGAALAARGAALRTADTAARDRIMRFMGAPFKLRVAGVRPGH